MPISEHPNIEASRQFIGLTRQQSLQMATSQSRRMGMSMSVDCLDWQHAAREFDVERDPQNSGCHVVSLRVAIEGCLADLGGIFGVEVEGECSGSRSGECKPGVAR